MLNAECAFRFDAEEHCADAPRVFRDLVEERIAVANNRTWRVEVPKAEREIVPNEQHGADARSGPAHGVLDFLPFAGLEERRHNYRDRPRRLSASLTRAPAPFTSFATAASASRASPRPPPWGTS